MEPTDNSVHGCFQRASEFLADAILLLKEGSLFSAVDRAYYARFWATRAALLHKGITTRTHNGLLIMNRWTKAGVLDRIFTVLQQEQIVRIKLEVMALDSTQVKVHPDGTGARKKADRKPSARREADGTPRFIWLPQMLVRP